MRKIVLGSECDDALFAKLCAVIESLGGSVADAEWVLGGSQELTRFAIKLPNGTLEAISETYIGLLLRGEDDLVLAVSSLVRT
ncbi:hypothetical protein RQP53_24655 [Paucibacter sp. APW11]|uniref:Phosphoserine phosphatase SerB n=1 Tax=Roseateles aquae TaxID=3077235 RepID=A0ABU3PIU3_9BURK|nr:hypothetical protein [Paucibacter sp. APW11]MDT9002486.1 hypothetical protein [Paucibacter sp. APW11]